jgi:DNA gyrase/topoisomerase IV subunit A
MTRALLECVATNLEKGMSKSIQRLQARTIREELAKSAQQERSELLSEIERIKGILAMNEMAFNNNKFVLSQAETEIEHLRAQQEHKPERHREVQPDGTVWDVDPADMAQQESLVCCGQMETCEQACVQANDYWKAKCATYMHKVKRAQQERKPMNDESIKKAFDETPYTTEPIEWFEYGVRAAEEFHGKETP